MKYVAVEGMVLTYTAKMGETPMGAAVVTAQPGAASQTVKADGKGVYVDGTTLTATAWTVGAYAGGGTVVASFESSAEFVKVDGRNVLLEGDSAEFEVSATNPSGDTQTFTITATVQSAGQISVSAE
ncbi:hypothetical protein [Fibrobacter sp. UWH4]|uniref:hypothetical protein n=1 Tax=Fibrobacter sp. UWH4 TaxID=1896210 RepID=UPI000914F174|nr:hypothetical protein [Fibrobacter sp. UWH4]SHL04522.1 hypothetical protein SAMN05720762_10450 [Fibrobacter sp. UWH4]